MKLIQRKSIRRPRKPTKARIVTKRKATLKKGDMCLRFSTSNVGGAGTDSDVTVRFYGEKGKYLAGYICRDNGENEPNPFGLFERGQTNKFLLGNAKDDPLMGELFYETHKITISIRPITNDHPDWHLFSVGMYYYMGAYDVQWDGWKVDSWIKPGKTYTVKPKREKAQKFEAVQAQRLETVNQDRKYPGTAIRRVPRWLGADVL